MNNESPVFTGRFGLEHQKVLFAGRNVHVVTFENKEVGHYYACRDQFAVHKGRDFDPQKDFKQVDAGWDIHCVVRGYNVEDAVNHYPAACAQMRACQEGVADYLTAPFRDDQGNLIFNELGRQVTMARGQFACSPPCKDAAAGIVHSEMFGFPGGFFQEPPGWIQAKSNERFALDHLDILNAGTSMVRSVEQIRDKCLVPVVYKVQQILRHADHELSEGVKAELEGAMNTMRDVMSDEDLQAAIRAARTALSVVDVVGRSQRLIIHRT